MKRLRRYGPAAGALALLVVSAVVIGRNLEWTAPDTSPLLADPYRWEEPPAHPLNVPSDEPPEVLAGSTKPGPPRRLYLIFTDGICWNMVKSLKKEGRLPNLSRILDGAAVGSTQPYHGNSIINWTSLATGCKPSEHGITWTDADPNPAFRLPRDVKRPSLWDFLWRRGISVGIADYPLLAEIGVPEGSYVYLDDGEEGKVSRPGLVPREELENRDPPMQVLDGADVKAYLRDAYPTRVYLTIIDAPDKQQHQSIWSFYEARRLGDKAPEYVKESSEKLASLYATYDKWLAPLVDRLDKDTIFIVSESGGRAVFPQRNIRVHGEFLGKLLHEFPGTQSAAVESLGDAGDGLRFRWMMPLLGINKDELEKKPSYKDQLLGGDAPAFQAIPYEQATSRLAPHSPPLANRDGDLYLIPSVEAARDLVTGGSKYDTVLQMYAMEGVHEEPEKGVFIAKGPGIKAVNVGTIPLADVAPTALAVLGIGKPESMSGKVLPCVP
ncbi:MAG: alkaline phosphatase family protein [Deltaproteobacteria bacterium]|nr:alkaline phosphatase family protein [Deltaproteobacteria bacterium]